MTPEILQWMNQMQFLSPYSSKRVPLTSISLPRSRAKRLLCYDGSLHIVTEITSPIDITIRIVFSEDLIHPHPKNDLYVFVQPLRANQSCEPICGPLFLDNSIFDAIYIESDDGYDNLDFLSIKGVCLEPSIEKYIKTRRHILCVRDDRILKYESGHVWITPKTDDLLQNHSIYLSY